ncbi:MAG: bifunctional sugar-1-phosphate nucleotidylyltransferase/acetyltransferase [Candidatus Micrarchaeia archaeon]|jgi:bifunctional UDP-N-acetylglucosamine pyrophosphorylase/glucosamine-1-phosphate N-acetyltransferase
MDFIILAAGKGERLWPLTESTPKCMVRVLGRPLLEWTVEAIEPYAEKIVIVVGHKKELLVEHFKAKSYSQKMRFAVQEKQEGTGHALLQAEKSVKGDFVAINGDNFFSPEALVHVCREANASKSAVVFAKKMDDCRNFGVFREKGGKIAGFEEKPKGKKPGLINLNLFKAPKKFFSYLHKLKRSPRGEYELPDALLAYALENECCLRELDGQWSDVGFFWNYIDANAYAAENLTDRKVEGIVEEGVVVRGKMHLGKGSVIKAPSRIEGPVWIGENATVGPHAFLRAGSVIENDCHVGSSEVKNSVLLAGANAPHFSYVGDSVLCEEVNLGAGTKIANLRFDNASVQVRFPTTKKEYDSARRKLGACIGRGTKVGINACINCGILVGENCKVFPGAKVASGLKSGTVAKE